MENSKSARLRSFQTVYKICLRWSVILLAEIFIMWSLFQYVVKERDYLKYQKWIGVAILAAALVYVVIAVFTDKEEVAAIRGLVRRMCSFEQIMLILLLIWYILDCAVRSKLDGEPLFKYNDNRLFMVTLSVFLFFPFIELMGSRARRIMEGMIHFTMPIYTAFCAWCIWRYYRVEFYTFPSGLKLGCQRMGVSMKMGGNVNITAAASAILFGLCLYMLLTQKTAIRIAYIPALLVHFVVVIISNSRTSLLTILAMTAVAAIFFVWDILQGKGVPARIAGGLVAAALCAVLILTAQNALLKMFAHVYPDSVEKYLGRKAGEDPEEELSPEEQARKVLEEKARESMTGGTQEGAAAQTTTAAATAEQTQEGAAAQTTTAAATTEQSQESAAAQTTTAAAAAEQAQDSAAQTQDSSTAKTKSNAEKLQEEKEQENDRGARKMDDLGGRSAVWKYAVQIICSSPDRFVFGVSPCFVQSRLRENEQFGESVTHTHNGLIQVALGLGVPAMLIYLLFEIGIIIRCLAIRFKGRGTPFRYSWIIPVIIMGILIIELMESMVFAMVRFNLPAFYMLAGCSVSMGRDIMRRDRMTQGREKS